MSGDFADGADAAHELLAECWSSADAQRIKAVIDHALAFGSTGLGIERLRDFDAAAAKAFTSAPSDEGEPPSVATQHVRRSALRLLFRAARGAGLADGDPTLDLELPARSPLATRPLTRDEIIVCRAAAAWALDSTRRAAAWALAEASGRAREVGHVTGNDLNLATGRVWLHGGRTTSQRWGLLSGWGHEALERHIQAQTYNPDAPLICPGTKAGESARVSASTEITDVLTRAGLGGEPDVRPASVAAWCGAEILAATGRIDEVARRLGTRSLDRTARFIGWDWTTAGP